jgi:hypothetical protein
VTLSVAFLDCRGEYDVMRKSRALIGKPVLCHATNERVLLIGTRPADHIMASGQSGCNNRPNT